MNKNLVVFNINGKNLNVGFNEEYGYKDILFTGFEKQDPVNSTFYLVIDGGFRNIEYELVDDKLSVDPSFIEYIGKHECIILEKGKGFLKKSPSFSLDFDKSLRVLTSPKAKSKYVRSESYDELIKKITVLHSRLQKKMEYYLVTFENGKVKHNSTILSFNDLLQKYHDPEVFLYMEYSHLTMIPNGVNEEAILSFSTTYQLDNKAYLAEVIVDPDGSARYLQSEIQLKNERVDSLNRRNIDTNHYPTTAALVEYVDENAYDDTELRQEINNQSNQIEELENACFGTKNKIDLSNVTWTREIINDSGVITDNSKSILSNYVDIKGLEYISFSGITEEDGYYYGCRLALYDDSKNFIKRVVICSQNVKTDYTVEPNVKYARIQYSSTKTVMLYRSADVELTCNDHNAYQYFEHKKYLIGELTIKDGYLYKCLENITLPEVFNESKWKETTFNEHANRKSIIHSDVENIGQLNVVKRCRQLTDIRWTPTFDIPRVSTLSSDYYGGSYTSEYKTTARFQDVFKAGKEYVGIPYSDSNLNKSYGYDQNFVGINIPIEVFVSAISNSNSIEITSRYKDVGNGTASFYGNICSSFASYAYGLDTFYDTNNLQQLESMNYVSYLVSESGERFDPYQLKVADMLIKTGHVAIITDIFVENGIIKAIEVSEGTKYGNNNPKVQGGLLGGVCRRKGWTIDKFYQWFKDFNLYRYANISNVEYTPSPYVNVGDEFEMERYNVPLIMPYNGNGFVYKTGYHDNTAKLICDYENTVFNKIHILKNGEDYGQLIDVASEINISLAEIGEYKAYLCYVVDGIEVVKTDSCHWSVI